MIRNLYLLPTWNRFCMYKTLPNLQYDAVWFTVSGKWKYWTTYLIQYFHFLRRKYNFQLEKKNDSRTIFQQKQK